MKDRETTYFVVRQPESGYDELHKMLDGRLITSVDQLEGARVIYGDGCTVRTDFRGIEVVSTLIAARALEGRARSVDTYVIGGGTAEWTSNDLNLDLNDTAMVSRDDNVVDGLRELFDGVIYDERNAKYLPPSAFKVQGTDYSMRELALRVRGVAIERSVEAANIHVAPIRVGFLEDNSAIGSLTLGTVLNKERDPKKSPVKFICPDCSRMEGVEHEHGITSDRKILKTHGLKEMRCRAARALHNGFKRGNLEDRTVNDLVRAGFYLGGSVVYQLLPLTDEEGANALLVRNYSNARGTMGTIAENWRGAIGVTRRYYFNGKVSVSGSTVPELLRGNDGLRDAVATDKFLVTNSEGDVYLPV